MSTSVWPSLIQIRSSSLAPGVSQPFATSDPPGTNPRAHACALRTFPKLEAVANAKTILGSEAVQKRGSHCCNSRVLTKGTGAGGEVPVLCPRRRGFTETPAALTAGPLLRGCPGRPAGPHPRRADTPSRQSGGRPDHGPDFPTDSRPTESNPDPASSPTTHLLPPWEITSGVTPDIKELPLSVLLRPRLFGIPRRHRLEKPREELQENPGNRSAHHPDLQFQIPHLETRGFLRGLARICRRSSLSCVCSLWKP
uniref:uncharacterized protein LOC118530132 isoform X2 n=1 Tax=Halichoerus grypus TaxID=9711 RepID=UPI001658C9CB|nr:uncharacterized protein LOC118530132 isoform X2 [Halichoerus grypus]